MKWIFSPAKYIKVHKLNWFLLFVDCCIWSMNMKVTILQNIKSLLKINSRLFYGAIRKAEKINFRAYGMVWILKLLERNIFPSKSLLKTELYCSICVQKLHLRRKQVICYWIWTLKQEGHLEFKDRFTRYNYTCYFNS